MEWLPTHVRRLCLRHNAIFWMAQSSWPVVRSTASKAGKRTFSQLGPDA